MSEQWEFFPCQMGEHKALVFYNHSIRESINRVDLPKCARFSISFREPADDGLAVDEETEDLNALEDCLVEELQRIGGIYVGRVSVDRGRHFYAYVDASGPQIDALAAKVAVLTGYPTRVTMEDDFDKSVYWHTLYPTKEDWQLMRDLKVIEQLKEDGDSLETERRIDHLAYFGDRRGVEAFKDWLETEGFDVDWSSRSDEGEELLGVSFSHACRPQLGEVTQHTFRLFKKIEELGGRYNGWGTTAKPAPEELAPAQ